MAAPLLFPRSKSTRPDRPREQTGMAICQKNLLFTKTGCRLDLLWALVCKSCSTWIGRPGPIKGGRFGGFCGIGRGEIGLAVLQCAKLCALWQFTRPLWVSVCSPERWEQHFFPVSWEAKMGWHPQTLRPCTPCRAGPPLSPLPSSSPAPDLVFNKKSRGCLFQTGGVSRLKVGEQLASGRAGLQGWLHS